MVARVQVRTISNDEGNKLLRMNVTFAIPATSMPEFLAFCRYLRSLHPTQVRIAIVRDNFSPHLSTKTDRRVGGGQRRTTSSSPTFRSTAAG